MMDVDGKGEMEEINFRSQKGIEGQIIESFGGFNREFSIYGFILGQ